MLNQAFKILRNIEADSSRTSKEGWLQEGIGNKFLEYLLLNTYDQHILFYIKKIPDVRPSGSEDKMGNRFVEFMALLGHLSSRSITGNEAISEVTRFLSGCSTEELYWYSKVLQKDLRIGITEKTINKIFGKNFIPEYNCILAEQMKNTKDLPDKFYLEPKLDGMRIQAFVFDNGDVTLKSRNGKIVTGFDQLEDELRQYMPWGNVYDGEIMNDNGTGSSFNQLMTKAFKKGNNKQGVYNMFDCVPIKEFEKEQSSKAQIERKIELVQIYKSIDSVGGVSSFKIVPHIGIFNKNDENDLSAMFKMYESFVNSGYEGAMVKDISMPYIYKRTKRLLKIKPMDDFDLRVVDLEEGTGKYKGLLGAAIVDFMGYRVNVGSGFNDEERALFWASKDLLLGKIIQVRAQEVTENKQGTKSLRFPIYKGIRLDK